MMPDHKETDDLNITISEASYSNPAAEFMYTRGKEIESKLAEVAIQPKTVREALETRELRRNLTYTELIEEVIERHPDWKTVPVDTLEKEYATQVLDSSAVNEIEQNTTMIEEITQRMASLDSSKIQLAIVKNKKGRGEYAYTYLVVYPPDPQTGLRTREASYPTAMCHLVDANSLLTQSEQVTCSGDEYDISFNQLQTISDEQLQQIVRETGKTPLDKVIQAGLTILDQIRKRSGEHIDPISAITNRDYAVKYALATHRGVGLVDNELLNLPPLTREHDSHSRSST